VHYYQIPYSEIDYLPYSRYLDFLFCSINIMTGNSGGEFKFETQAEEDARLIEMIKQFKGKGIG